MRNYRGASAGERVLRRGSKGLRRPPESAVPPHPQQGEVGGFCGGKWRVFGSGLSAVCLDFFLAFGVSCDSQGGVLQSRDAVWPEKSRSPEGQGFDATGFVTQHLLKRLEGLGLSIGQLSVS